MLSSIEFCALHPERQEQLRELADAVHKEIKKRRPQRSKVHQHGKRLLEKAADFGLTVFAHGLGPALAVLAMGDSVPATA